MTPHNRLYEDTFLRTPGCHCPEPVGDLREGTCILCGHQVAGHEMPVRPKSMSLGAGIDRSTFAKPTRKFRPAA